MFKFMLCLFMCSYLNRATYMMHKHIIVSGVSIHWTGLLDSPLTQKIVHTRLSLAPRLCQFVYYSADGLSWQASPSHFACNGLVPTSYCVTVYLNTIKLNRTDLLDHSKLINCFSSPLNFRPHVIAFVPAQYRSIPLQFLDE